MSANETAVLGGGCFWCVEAALKQLQGVVSIESGYMGGRRPNPSYEQVCTGATGHAEVVRVTFDPAVLSYTDLLEVFFTAHDPTTVDRQGNDVGSQYRSVIFADETQLPQAQAVIARLTAEQHFADPIVTQVAPLQEFWKAEDYHQDYFAHHPQQPYCVYVTAPKVAKVRQKFGHRMRG